MATTRSSLFLAASPVTCSAAGKSEKSRHLNLSRRMAVSREQKSSAATSVTTSLIEENNKLLEENKKKKTRKEENTELKNVSNVYSNPIEITEEKMNRKTLKDYFQECKDLIRRSEDEGGPGPPRSRWFSPLDCGPHNPESPLLLFLPG